MSDVITRNVPVYYSLSRIAFQLNEANEIVAMADLAIYNADERQIDDDHPATTLTTAEAAAFKTWVLGELAAYETATGLTRIAP